MAIPKPVVTPEDFEALRLANIALEEKVLELNAELESTKRQLKGSENAAATHLAQVERLQAEWDAERQDRNTRSRSLYVEAKPEYDPSEWVLTQRIFWGGKSIETADLTPSIVASLRETGTPLLKRKD
jgi:hypothetical protein